MIVATEKIFAKMIIDCDIGSKIIVSLRYDSRLAKPSTAALRPACTIFLVNIFQLVYPRFIPLGYHR